MYKIPASYSAANAVCPWWIFLEFPVILRIHYIVSSVTNGASWKRAREKNVPLFSGEVDAAKCRAALGVAADLLFCRTRGKCPRNGKGVPDRRPTFTDIKDVEALVSAGCSSWWPIYYGVISFLSIRKIRYPLLSHRSTFFRGRRTLSTAGTRRTSLFLRDKREGRFNKFDEYDVRFPFSWTGQ